MQQLLEKYAAKLEKTEQEKKEAQIRHGHQLANYSHELSRLERQLNHAHKLAQEKENELRLQKTRHLYHSSGSTPIPGSSSSSANGGTFHNTRGLLADDFWKELVPPSASSSHRRASVTFTSHVGLAFEHLLSHQMVAFHDHSLDASTRDWLREVRVCGGQMLQLHRSFQAMSCTFQQLAESSHLYQLAETLTKESRMLLNAEQALVFVVDTAEQEFWCRVPRSPDAKEMVTVRSKLMPFATAGHTHAQQPAPTGPDTATRPTPAAEAPPMVHLSAGGQPSGLASMVYHTKRPLLLPAGHTTKHPCYSTASDNTDRLISHPSASTLLLPIVHRGHALGVIQLCGKTTVIEALGLSIALEKCDAFTHEDQALLMLLVHFASGLFPKVSYFTEVESNKVNEETLIQLAPEIFTCLRFEELGKIVIQNAKEILDADRCSLFVADNVERTLHNWQSDISGGTVQVYENTKKSGMTIPFGHGIVGLVAETWQVINIPDAYEDPRFNSSWNKKTNYRTKSMLAVPILTNTTKRQPIRRASHFAAAGNESTTKPGTPTPQSQGRQTEQTLLGVVQVINKSGGAPFRTKDEFLLKTITKLIALAIENSQLFQKNQELCSNLGKLIANGDLVEAMISLGTSAEDIIGVECAAIYVYDHLAQEMVTFHRKRRHKIVVKEQMYRHSLFGDAVASKELVIVNAIDEMPNFNAYVDSIAGINAHNLLFAPLVVDDPDAIGVGGGTKLVGLMHLVNTKGRKLKFERHDLFLSIVTSMCCSVIASIMEKQTTLKQKDQTNQLLDTSMSFFKEMSPIGIINAVYNACTSIFSVEKAHLFLWEPDRRHMWTSKLLPHADANTVPPSSSFHGGTASPLRAAAGGGNITSGLSGVASLGSAGGTHSVPTLGSQLRRISVLTDQKLRVPTTEGLLEQVLVKGTVVLVKHWVEGVESTQEKTKPETKDERRGLGASSFRKYTLRITASDEKIGFTKHAVVACPVWGNCGLEIVGILVLLFPKGKAPSFSELTNLPILCRQISGALNVCSDLSAISARSKKLQSMLELSMKKPEIAMSLTLSARGQLVTFSQPLNVATPGFDAVTLASDSIDIGIRSLPMDENGNRWGFQLSAAGIHEMHAEHFLKWIGKDLTASQVFDKLRANLQSAYVRKEAITGEIDRKSTEVREQFADPHTDLVNVEQIFQTLAPQIIAVAHFQYEIIPILDPITQSIVSIHVILTAM
uniref:GAF domain-containing protein n=1 Tax=Globisporangium ultimum (strain ATCC 200006 / CBS 805.95 / DAOM BR144) TaxID=431595 RepID=K3WWF1_GLOUD